MREVGSCLPIIDKARDLDQPARNRGRKTIKEAGVFRCRRDIFTNEDLFELEMKHIFESNWVYLAHESQIPENNDYYTTYIGRQPVVVTRDKNGELHAVINACAHRGAMLCRRKHGNKGSFTCPFHGWTFSNTGKLLKVKDEKTTQYPPQFAKDGSHDLKRVPRFESYRGFLFGSLKEDVPALEEYLGETKVIIDQIVDQAPNGLEVLRGNSSYIYDGNWKLQMENGCDGYHVSSVHWNYAATMGRRKEEGTKAVDANSWSRSVAGVYGFENGHILLWTNTMNPEVRPVYDQRHEIKARVGEDKTDFIVNQTRNLCLYPNVFLMDQFSTQIRVTAADQRRQDRDQHLLLRAEWAKALRTAHCASASTRISSTCPAWARPTTSKSSAPARPAMQGPPRFGTTCRAARRSGSTARTRTPREWASQPLLSGERSEDEGLFVRQHEYWAKVMREALAAEKNGVVA